MDDHCEILVVFNLGWDHFPLSTVLMAFGVPTTANKESFSGQYHVFRVIDWAWARLLEMTVGIGVNQYLAWIILQFLHSRESF